MASTLQKLWGIQRFGGWVPQKDGALKRLTQIYHGILFSSFSDVLVCVCVCLCVCVCVCVCVCQHFSAT